MGDTTGISWADSTMNWWEGCTKVGPGCEHCYALDRDIRYNGGAHWGAGAPRRQMSEHTRNNPGRWQRDAAKFFAEHGHPRRVFASSLADIFDNEVDPSWRAEAFTAMESTPDLRWMLCTKRVSNIAKMVPDRWKPAINRTIPLMDPPADVPAAWPRNVGNLITTVTPEEIARDVPRLVELKMQYGIPWVGLSIEPMIADVADALSDLGAMLNRVDWIILGGESGRLARECDIHWMKRAIVVALNRGVSVFVKQMGDDPTYGGAALRFTGAGKDPLEWPEDIRLQQFPAALS